MRKIFSLLLAAAFTTSALAQIDRSVRPTPGKSPELEFGEAEVFELDNGLKVIVVENHKLPRISMNLVIDRDPVFEGDKAGYVSLAGDMMRQGTSSRPKEKLDEEIDFMGASLSTSSNSIYTGGLSKYSEKLMEILADVILNPAFPQEEFDKLSKQMISGIESNKDDPEAVSGNVHDALLYGKKHPYGELTTVESVKNVSLEDIQTYYRNYWIPNISYLAIVGDIDEDEAEELAEKYLGKWQKANDPQNMYPRPETPAKPQVSLVNQDNAVQSVLRLGNTIDLEPGSEDVVALRLANQILGGGSLGRLFQNIREDKGYTYGAYSSYSSDRLVGEFSANASVRNEVTDSAITEFLNEFKRLRTELVPEDELANAKAAIIGSFGRSLERPQTLASFALNIERYDLDDDYYEEYIERLNDLSAEDVREAAKKYIKPENLQITVVGKASEIADKLQKFGELQYYDKEANVTDKPNEAVPSDVTTAMVVEDYIKALGGKEALQEVKTMQVTYDVAIQGAPPLKAEIAKKRPNMYKLELTAEGMGSIQRQVYNGEKGVSSGMQGKKELEGEELESLALEAEMYPELNYLSEDYKLKLTEIAKVEGEKAYVMEVTNPLGKTSTQFYSVESGLLLKESQQEEGPNGEQMNSTTTYLEYADIDGIKYPKAMTIKTGPQTIQFTEGQVNINSDLPADTFKL